MKSPLPLLAVLAFITALLAFRVKEYTSGKKIQADRYIQSAKTSIGCGPDWASLQQWLDEVSIGHALICDALYLGLENTVQIYKRQLTH